MLDVVPLHLTIGSSAIAGFVLRQNGIRFRHFVGSLNLGTGVEG